MNLLWLLLCYHALIRISLYIYSSMRIQKLTALLLFFCFPAVLSCTFLYGNIPAFSCGTVAVWMFLAFLNRKKLKYALVFAAAMTLAVILKLNLLIFALAIAIVWVFDVIRTRSVKSLICFVLAAACVIRQITFEVQLVADAPTELLILGAHVFQQLTAENIHVECCMYRLATERFSDVMWAMQQLLFTSFDKRLAQYLWDESDHARAPVRATHEQIARDTGAVRETVTRMLRHFADDGIVSLGRGTVTVADAEKLRRLAGM